MVLELGDQRGGWIEGRGCYQKGLPCRTKCPAGQASPAGLTGGNKMLARSLEGVRSKGDRIQARNSVTVNGQEKQ